MILFSNKYFLVLYEQLCTLASSRKLTLMYSLLSTSVKLQKQQMLTVNGQYSILDINHRLFFFFGVAEFIHS